MSDKKSVVIARVLLPAGRELLDAGFDVAEGGLDSDREALLELVPGAAAIVADPTVPIDDGVLDAAGDQLEAVANFAVGYDNIDVIACRKRGVTVTNTPDVLTNATAELAAGLTYAAARGITASEARMRAGEWRGWDPGAHLGLELSGATIGIVGMGRIGRRYAELMSGLGGDFLYTSRERKEEVEVKLGARRVDLDQLLRQSDVVSLHLPATPETTHLIDASALALMKPTAILINTGRGPVVDSEALAAALETGQIAGAGLDVYEGEPNVPQRLLDAPNTALTPHIGSATTRARDDMASLVARNVIAVLAGEEPLTPVA
ncbi:MAG: D-glycerate dehydrogenase [Thermoleophilia bacterium]|nr:D-glycerate dehydrogenase [Thermoleophilia bacterium]